MTRQRSASVSAARTLARAAMAATPLGHRVDLSSTRKRHSSEPERSTRTASGVRPVSGKLTPPATRSKPVSPTSVSEEGRQPCRRGHVDQRQGGDRRPVGLNPLQAQSTNARSKVVLPDPFGPIRTATVGSRTSGLAALRLQPALQGERGPWEHASRLTPSRRRSSCGGGPIRLRGVIRAIRIAACQLPGLHHGSKVSATQVALGKP